MRGNPLTTFLINCCVCVCTQRIIHMQKPLFSLYRSWIGNARIVKLHNRWTLPFHHSRYESRLFPQGNLQHDTADNGVRCYRCICSLLLLSSFIVSVLYSLLTTISTIVIKIFSFLNHDEKIGLSHLWFFSERNFWKT